MCDVQTVRGEFLTRSSDSYRGDCEACGKLTVVCDYESHYVGTDHSLCEGCRDDYDPTVNFFGEFSGFHIV